MNPLNLLLKLGLAFYCSYKTSISVSKFSPSSVTPSASDPVVINWMAFENEIYKEHWQWITQKFLPDDSQATGFPMPSVNLASIATSLAPSAVSNVIPVVSSVAQALGLPGSPAASK